MLEDYKTFRRFLGLFVGDLLSLAPSLFWTDRIRAFQFLQKPANNEQLLFNPLDLINHLSNDFYPDFRARHNCLAYALAGKSSAR
jgi:hypothetical protein